MPIPAWPFLHWWPITKAHTLLTLKRIFLGGVVICFLFSETNSFFFFFLFSTHVKQKTVYCNFQKKKKSTSLRHWRRWEWQKQEMCGEAVVGQEAVTVISEASSFQGVWCVLSLQQRRPGNNNHHHDNKKAEQNKTKQDSVCPFSVVTFPQ